MQYARVTDAENGPNVRDAKAVLHPGKAAINQQPNRRALGDIGNLVGGFNQKVHVGKESEANEAKPASQSRAGVLTRRAAAQLAAAGNTTQTDSWGAKPRPGLRARDASLPAPEASTTAAGAPEARPPGGRSMSQLLLARSQTAGSPAARARGKGASEKAHDIDAADAGNHLAVADYVSDIYGYYRRVEPDFSVAPDYMTRQSDVNERMRAILVDWLVDVHLKFKLMPETLFLTLSVIDRFLEAKQVTRKHLQLVGVTAMLIASKYEEIWAPEVRDFVYISDRAYSREQILQMEKIMLNTLRFNLTVPTAYSFLARFLKAAGCAEDREVALTAAYLVELALPDYACLAYEPSRLAAAAVMVARSARGREDALPAALRAHCAYGEAELRPCAAALAGLHRKAPTSSLAAVFKKYGADKMLGVAKMSCAVFE